MKKTEREIIITRVQSAHIAYLEARLDEWNLIDDSDENAKNAARRSTTRRHSAWRALADLAIALDLEVLETEREVELKSDMALSYR